MTYCVGLLLDQGLVLASDSRTNAGVDYISSYSKLHLFQPAPDRIFVLLAAGSLATTREVVDRIHRDLDQAANLQAPPPGLGTTLLTANYLFEVANYVGQMCLAVQNEHAPALRPIGVSAEATFILGGQIAGQPHGLFLVYPQGNAIAATPETPYLQIGESKFGKPVLDEFRLPWPVPGRWGSPVPDLPGGDRTFQPHRRPALRASRLPAGPACPLLSAQVGG